MTQPKNTYLFARGRSFPELESLEVDELKGLLGGKGYGLYVLTCVLGLRCPAVLNLPTFHAHSLVEGKLPAALVGEIEVGLAELEQVTGKRFGDPANPLLVSARSGAKFSMPGMLDSILNLGLNDALVASLATGEAARFWLDSYRRLLQMYADVVFQLKGPDGEDPFERALADLKVEVGAGSDLELGPDQLRELIKRFQRIYAEFEVTFPQTPAEQVLRSAEAVFRSWNNERAIFTREQDGIPHDLGTAVNLQEMVFGNKSPRCASGCRR